MKPVSPVIYVILCMMYLKKQQLTNSKQAEAQVGQRFVDTEQLLSLLPSLVLDPVCRQQESLTGISEVCLGQCHSLARLQT